MKKRRMIVAVVALIIWSLAEYALIELHHQSSISGIELYEKMEHNQNSAYGWWMEGENETFYWVRYAPGSRYYCLAPEIECELFRVRKSEIRIEIADNKRRVSGNIKFNEVVLLKQE